MKKKKIKQASIFLSLFAAAVIAIPAALYVTNNYVSYAAGGTTTNPATKPKPKPPVVEYNPTGRIIYDARNSKNHNVHTGCFDSNNKSPNATHSGCYFTHYISYKGNETTPTASDTGYIFHGWSRTASSSARPSESEVEFKPGALIKFAYSHNACAENESSPANGMTLISGSTYMTTTLYGIWEERSAMLKYRDCGHREENFPDDVRMFYTCEYKLKAPPKKPGYRFKEWNTEPDGNGTSYKPGDRIKGAEEIPQETVLYAIWYEPVNKCVTFDANGGSDAPEPVYREGFERVHLPKEKPVRKTYTFVGWNTERDGTGKTYQPNDFVNEEDIKIGKIDEVQGDDYKNNPTTLYAQWTKDITIKKNKTKLDVTYSFFESDYKNGILDAEVSMSYYNFFKQRKTVTTRRTVLIDEKSIEDKSGMDIGLGTWKPGT